jgi:hypothetical protein
MPAYMGGARARRNKAAETKALNAATAAKHDDTLPWKGE